MKARRLSILFSVLLALFSITMPAQGLPVLPSDKNITVGTLDNGITYYIVNNKVDAARLDISLVQRAGYSSEDSLSRGSSVVHSIGALATLPKFKSPTPLRYLVANAVWPGPEGYVTIGQDATVFRFRDIPVTPTMETVDSTLLMVFEIINAAPGAKSGRYPVGSQAIILSGDITASVATGKLGMLSMLIDGKDADTVPDSYEWHPFEGPVINRLPAPAPMLGTFSLTWNSSRTNREQMKTIQPLASGLFFRQLARLSEKRLSQAFRDAGIAVTGLKAEYIGSDKTSGDETFTVKATVAMRDYKNAASLIVSTMADIDKYGSNVAEYRDISAMVRSDIALTGGTGVTTNAGYTEKCLSSFLYGTSLATDKANADYLIGRVVDPSVSLKLFNSFSAAILDGTSNLTVTSRADTTLLSVKEIKSFLKKWDSTAEEPVVPITAQSDTLSLTVASAHKIKLKDSQEDPMAGGQILTYSNGMRVVYKKTDSKGVFRFSWNLKGGWSSIPELKPGEGAYVGDMLLLGNIGPMSGQRFKDMLSANGITLEVSVTPNDMSLRGAAPSDKLPLLMKALAAIANKRSPDAAAFTKYCHSLAIRHMLEASSLAKYKTLTDSLLCPKNRYISEKLNIGLPKNLPVKAETFFSRQFANMSSGVLIITGDVSESAVRKTMLSWLGRFPSGKGSATRFRNEAAFSTSLRSKVLPAADEAGIYLGFTAPAEFNQTEFITSGLAAKELERAVCETVVPLGWTCKAKWDLLLFPDERITVYLSLVRQDYRGMPASLVPVDSVANVMAAAQASIASLAQEGITSQRLTLGKLSLVSNINSWVSDPKYLLRLFELRYNYGRDFLTGLQDKANKIKIQDVNAMIDRLVSGGRSELLIPKKAVRQVIIDPVLPEPELPFIPKIQKAADSTGMTQLLKEVMLQWQITEP